MFVQVIRGKATDPQALRHLMDRWTTELAPGATGWLGTTAGVTDDGELVIVARFESQEAARANSDRPEQGQWWSQAETLIENPVFADATDVVQGLGGANPSARFVQVIEGRVLNQDLARRLLEEMDSVSQSRPDVIGMLVALHGDRSTTTVFFTDEASARAGEAQAPTPEDREFDEQLLAAIGDLSYLDLRDPWHYGR